jgi:tetratricopeptide (TPR) repeat protein
VIDAAKWMAWFDSAVEREPDNALIRRGWLLSLTTFACLVPTSLPDVLSRLRSQMRRTRPSGQATVEAYIAAGMTSMFNSEHRLAADMLYRAVELGPQNADARVALSTLLLQMGESEQALREARAGEQFDPLSAANAGMVALSLINLDRFEEARAQSERSLSLDPAFLLSRMMVADLDLLAGNCARALHSMAEICTLTGQHPLARGRLAYACGITGDASRARALLGDLLASANNTRQVAPSIVLGYLGLREQKSALKWLRIAGEHNSIADIMPGRLPFFDPLRGEPSFEALAPQYR